MPIAYVPGLDALRAVAAIAVLAFHTRLPGLQGGFIGVDVFFVLSGYLTASIALSGRHSVLDFMTRRLFRLWPLMLAFVAAASAVHIAMTGAAPVGLAHGLLFSMDAVAAERGPVGWMTHLWTLGIEMKFYLVVALLAAALNRKAFLIVCLLCWAAVTTNRLIAADQFATGFYSFATHSSGLFLGAALAVAPLSPSRRAAGLAAIALTGLFSAAVFSSPLALAGYIMAAEIAVAILVARASSSGLAQIAETRVLRYLGKISFGIYLWHYPIAIIARDALPGVAAFTITLAASVALAAASFRLIERPAQRLWRPLRQTAVIE